MKSTSFFLSNEPYSTFRGWKLLKVQNFKVDTVKDNVFSRMFKSNIWAQKNFVECKKQHLPKSARLKIQDTPFLTKPEYLFFYAHWKIIVFAVSTFIIWVSHMAHSKGKNLYFPFFKLSTSYHLPPKKLSDLLIYLSSTESSKIIKKTAKWLFHLSKSLNFFEDFRNVIIVLKNEKYKLFSIEWTV